MASPFNPEAGGEVPKEEALKWIEKYDKEHRKEKDKDTKSVFFGRDILLRLLAQPGASGITFFFASKYSDFAKKDTVNLVLVARREDGSLIWPDDSPTAKSDGGGMTVDNNIGCPPYC
jgi:hypothetical protein